MQRPKVPTAYLRTYILPPRQAVPVNGAAFLALSVTVIRAGLAIDGYWLEPQQSQRRARPHWWRRDDQLVIYGICLPGSPRIKYLSRWAFRGFQTASNDTTLIYRL